MATYCFDLDNTLCITVGTEYEHSKPIKNRIKIVNDLYDAEHKIIIDTGRGSGTGKDWFELTKKQLEDWGVKYHVLRSGIKFAADYYIDDKGVRDIEFFSD